MKIAIVGHDKTLPGKGLGPLIDSYDYVVKMINCGWQNPDDYGHKYDFAIATKGSFNLESLQYPSIETWIYSKIFDGLNNLGVGNRDINFLLKPIIDKYFHAIAGRTVTNGISRGCAAVLTSILLLMPDVVMLFGMSQLATGNRQTDRHPKIYKERLTDEQRSLLPPLNDHCWQSEHKLILKIADANKCKLLTNIVN